MPRVIFIKGVRRQDKMKNQFISISIILLTLTLTFASLSPTSFTAKSQSSNPAWQISITGLVNNPSTFTIAELEAMPQTTVNAAIICVDFPTTVVTQGNWKGVKLWTLLTQVGIQPEASKVAFHASDGYSSDLTIDVAKGDNIILAYAKDGEPLTENLRLVVPGHWGYKWVSLVTVIDLVNFDFKGKWESQGYSDDGIVTSTNKSPNSPNYTLPTTQNLPTNRPSATPEASPTTNPTSPVATQQSLSKNPQVQNFNIIEIVPVIAVAIATIAFTLIIIKKNRKNSLSSS
jgi:DMSO/TMAO reductase YedYZ molybdopterin-dependent catalytic subunit